MNVSIHLLLTNGDGFAELQRAFCEEAPADWNVSLVTSVERLLPRLADPSGHHLVVVSYSKQAGDIAASVHRTARDAAVVVVAERGNVDLAAQAIEAGATDARVRAGGAASGSGGDGMTRVGASTYILRPQTL